MGAHDQRVLDHDAEPDEPRWADRFKRRPNRRRRDQSTQSPHKEAADGLIMGRNTYDVYATVWPNRDDPYAEILNVLPKYVASTQLTEPAWANTTVISTDLVGTVADLRAEEGGTLLMHGFGPVAKSLLVAGLLDELHLWYHPALAGVGGPDDRLFTDGLAAGFEHLHTRTLDSGVVILAYKFRTTGSATGTSS